MTQQMILELGRDTLIVAALIAGPLLLVGMTVGLLIGVLQTITSVHEQTLTFVPKIVAVLFAVSVLMPWMIGTICRFTTALLSHLGRFAS